MKAVLYILRFHGLGLATSLTVLAFGIWGLFCYMPPESSEGDVVLKAPFEVLLVQLVLFAFVIVGIVGLLRLLSIAVQYWGLFNKDGEESVSGR